MPFEITDAENDVINKALRTGEISESDKAIIDGFIARLSSDSDLPTVDTISKEQMDELTKEIISLLSQYGIKIDTADNGDITFILPNGVKKTHNINAVITPTSDAVITPTSKAIITPTSDAKNRPRWRAGKHTQKNGKKTKVRGGSGSGIKDGLRKAIILFLVGLVATIVFPLSIKLIYDYYHEQHAPDDISEETTHVETPMPKSGDTYVANVKYTQESKSTIEHPLDYEEGDEISIIDVPKNFGEGKGKDKIVPASKAVKNEKGEITFKKLYGFVDLANFHKKVEPIYGGSKNRKSRSKTRKQKRRKTKK